MTSGDIEDVALPSEFQGMPYFDFLPQLAVKRGVQRYLEVGVCEGFLLSRMTVDVAVGVDPNYILKYNVMHGKKKACLHQVPSDAFFADQTATATLGGAPDFAFLDGLHTFEFLLRDFYNTEALCGERSLICMHDCLPLSAAMAHRNQAAANELTRGTPFHGYWTGDVWKIVPILQNYRPDLRIVCVDAAPTGLVFVTGLDPRSDVLRRNYLKIVDEFRALGNGTEELLAFYKSIDLVATGDVLNDFDHSLFFVS